jgi:limonene-1,2-epoxide hydrolase
MSSHSVASPEAAVRAFFRAWESDGFLSAFERYMHPEAVWQNSGFPDAVGRDACLGLMRQYLAFSGLPYGRVEIRHLAVSGSAVLTERVDHLFAEDGRSSHAAPIMGVFVVEDGLIKRYSDYFDPCPFLEMVKQAQGGG